MCALIMTTMPSCNKSHTPEENVTEKFAAAMDSLMRERYGADSAAAPGGSVLIAKGDSVLYEAYFGTADLATGEPIDSATLFCIASVSKQFTVAAVLKQMEAGTVDIDSAAARYLPYKHPLWQRVTLADLAGHTSGIPDDRDRSSREACVFATDETSVEYFPGVTATKFEPGTAYDYLNPSFILLANVVADKTGMTFTDYAAQALFRPAGMKSTVYFSPEGMPVHTSHAYEPDSAGRWHEYDYGEETFFATRPDGGIYSTVRDMTAWNRALMGGRMLSDSLRRKVWAPRVSVSDSPWCDYQRRPNTWYGLGWFIERVEGCPDVVYHTGDNGGYQAYSAMIPDEDISIVVLENRHDQPRRAMTQAIMELLRQCGFMK